MVFQKKLDVGFIGCQIPTMPRFPRSARGKRSPPKKVENNQMHPFDLLATVAGELLAKRESTCSLCETAERTNHVNSTKQKQLDNGSPSKSDVFDQGSCDEGSFVARFVSHEERRAASALALVKSDVSEKDGFAEKSAQSGLKCELLQKLKTTGSLKNDAIGIHNLEDPMDLDSKTLALVSSDSSVELTPFVDYDIAHSNSFQSVKDVAELVVDKDDDENSSGRTHNCAIYSKAFKPHCTGERRVRKVTTSNYWKADREVMNDGEIWNRDEELKPALHSRKLSYTRQRTQRSSFKRKKSVERFSFSASNGGFCSQDVPDSLVKCDTKFDSSDPHAHLNDAHGRSCFTTDQRSSYEPADHPVKLSIKSFRVPELFIEIPANATVGSLKRTVVEAVTAVLSGGLRVGVLLQGKKIRDDSKTLLQAGISNTDKLDNLGFTLEPNPNRAPPPPRNSNSREPESPNKILTHAAAAPDQATPDTITQPPPNTTANCTESDHDSVHSHTNPSSSVDQLYDNSKALVPILAVKSDALSVIPLPHSRRSEMVRRIRRPFSVSEVEALVQAVEKLGTGRWRDVKLRAFDSVKHRTYVDLKDKWKTLVHTARISPQQRRGEPVPQDLLDRVLSAHAYWCQQQAKSTRLAEPYLLPA